MSAERSLLSNARRLLGHAMTLDSEAVARCAVDTAKAAIDTLQILDATLGNLRHAQGTIDRLTDAIKQLQASEKTLSLRLTGAARARDAWRQKFLAREGVLRDALDTFERIIAEAEDADDPRIVGIRLAKVEREQRLLLEELARAAEWEDTSYWHAIKYVRHFILSLRDNVRAARLERDAVTAHFQWMHTSDSLPPRGVRVLGCTGDTASIVRCVGYRRKRWMDDSGRVVRVPLLWMLVPGVNAKEKV